VVRVTKGKKVYLPHEYPKHHETKKSNFATDAEKQKPGKRNGTFLALE